MYNYVDPSNIKIITGTILEHPTSNTVQTDVNGVIYELPINYHCHIEGFNAFRKDDEVMILSDLQGSPQKIIGFPDYPRACSEHLLTVRASVMTNGEPGNPINFVNSIPPSELGLTDNNLNVASRYILKIQITLTDLYAGKNYYTKNLIVISKDTFNYIDNSQAEAYFNDTSVASYFGGMRFIPNTSINSVKDTSISVSVDTLTFTFNPVDKVVYYDSFTDSSDKWQYKNVYDTTYYYETVMSSSPSFYVLPGSIFDAGSFNPDSTLQPLPEYQSTFSYAYRDNNILYASDFRGNTYYMENEFSYYSAIRFTRMHVSNGFLVLEELKYLYNSCVKNASAWCSTYKIYDNFNVEADGKVTADILYGSKTSISNGYTSHGITKFFRPKKIIT
jgi:hypothetical protein